MADKTKKKTLAASKSGKKKGAAATKVGKSSSKAPKKAAKGKAKTGRPSKFKKEFIEQARKLCRLGAINTDLADFFGVSTSTIDNWIAEIPEFLGAIKGGREIADAAVVRALFERATGYEHPEDKIFMHEGVEIIVPTIKHYPPDSTAAIFWLKNRLPDDWKDRKAVEMSNEKDEDGEKVAFLIDYKTLPGWATDPRNPNREEK